MGEVTLVTRRTQQNDTPKIEPESRHKQLWIVDQYSVPPTLPGFTRQYEHAYLMSEHGWKTRIIASPFNHKTHAMDRPVSLIRRRFDALEDGVPFSWVYSVPYRGNNWRRYLNMVSYLITSQISSRGIGKPDAVLASSPHLFTGLAGWLLAKRYRVPFVFEVRDLWPESLVQLGLTNPIVVRPLEWIEKFLYRRADAIVALTDGIGDSIRSRVAKPEKVHVIPNGARVAHPITEERRNDLRRSRGWEGNFIVGWVGAHGTANRLETLIDAAEALNEGGVDNVRIVLIGDGPQKTNLVARASGLQNVQFFDPLPKSDVVEVLQAMDAGVIVHDDTIAVRGARPNKLFDYLAAGLPIISDLQGETARILEEAAAGITVPTMQPARLADAVQILASDTSMTRQLGHQGRAYLRSTHERGFLAQKLSAVLDGLSKSTGPENTWQ